MKERKEKVLFICKERSNYNQSGSTYGLINSCNFVSNYLNDIGIEAKTIRVVDNNQIDKEVTDYKPTIAIIEALWVVPDKFRILNKLHPNIKWIIRIHSKTPFLAGEGIAITWIKEYIDLQYESINIQVAVNNIDFLHDSKKVISEGIIYLPNIYYPKHEGNESISKGFGINIGCFGALRLFKNQLQQAFAAIIFADKVGKDLYFHINNPKAEKEANILKNLQALFAGTRHTLVMHDWLEHKDFLNLVKAMDLGMQVSFTESFNIVTADFVHSNIPIIVGKDIDWMPYYSRAEPSDTTDIVDKLLFVYKTSRFGLHKLNKKALKDYNKKSEKVWRAYLNC